MSSNAPPFDPLRPTEDEQADMLRGYLDGWRGRPMPEDDRRASIAYMHGRRNGVNDKAGYADPEQMELARRWAKERADA